MTELEWLTSDDPQAMLQWLEDTRVTQGHLRNQYNDQSKRYDGGPSDRKLRLFACAYCRATGMAKRLKEIEHVDRCADTGWTLYGTGSHTDLSHTDLSNEGATFVARSAAGADWGTAYMNYEWGDRGLYGSAEWDERVAARQRFKADILRDIVGNPFDVGPKWASRTVQGVSGGTWALYGLPRMITPDVASLAIAAYETRRDDKALDHARLLVLSDALEEAGCEDEAVLLALRDGSRRHYRGFWPLDLVLGKH